MRSPHAPILLVLAALLIVPALPVAPGPLGSHTHIERATTLSGPFGGSGGPVGALRTALGATSGGPGAPPSVAVGCPGVVSQWLALYSRGLLPPVVAGTDTPSCVPGADDLGLSYLSNRTDSGSRFEVTLALPDSSSYVAGSLAAFWIGVAVSGVPCSLDGQSILRVQFIPPTNPYGSGASAHWQVRAPIWDLVPAGSCDPQCQNSSALFTIGGVRFCEDDAVVFGPNARAGSPIAFAEPGDVVRVELAGSTSAPLAVYLNDSTHIADSTNWQYPGVLLAAGQPISSANSTAPATTGWTFGGAVSVGWTNCPVVNGSGPTGGCNSYAGPTLRTLSYPRVTATSLWNATTTSFSDAYSSFRAWSSSGGCTGVSGTSACADFSGLGGSGIYPSLAIYASGGRAWVGYGANATDRVGLLAGPATGIAPDGSATTVSASEITRLNASVDPNATNFTVRATDPRGVSSVLFGALWCYLGGTSTTPVVYTTQGTEGNGSANGSEDGVFTLGLPRGNATTQGTLYYWARLFDPSGGPGSMPVFGQLPVRGTGAHCGASSPPPPSITGATPIDSGYRVTWTYPNAFAGGVRNFSVIAVPTGGGSATVRSIPDPDARSAVVRLSPNASYTIYVAATSLDGVTIRLPSGVPALPTLAPFSATASASPGELWLPNAVASASVAASGGAASHCFAIAWGDGTSNRTCAASAVVSHAYSGYLGVARIRVVANDSAGDVAAANASLVQVRATPLGVHTTVYAGDGVVNVNWTAPPSPSGPVTRYVVYFTSDPVSASDLTVGWPDNVSGAHPAYLRNTTGTSLDNVAVPDTSAFFVEVVAWNSYGGGLVSSAGYAVGRPAPLTATFAPAPSGGVAPYTTSLYAIVTSGSPNALISAVFFSGSSPGVAASVTTIGGTSWVNGSYTFPNPGPARITLHVVDALNEATAITQAIYIAPGAPPFASIAVLTPTPYEGQPVSFQATIVAGTGPYNYSWQFGDGSAVFDAGAHPSHTFASAGQFTVVLTTTDNSTGGVGTTSTSFPVYSTPTVSITPSAAGSDGLAFRFQAVVHGGSGTSVIAWAFGDGTGGAGANVTHTYSTTGVYNVSVTATDPTRLSAKSSVLVYAGVARATVPFLGGSEGVELFTLAAVGLVVLGGAAAYFFRKSRKPRVLDGEPVARARGPSSRPMLPDPSESSIEPPPEEPPSG